MAALGLRNGAICGKGGFNGGKRVLPGDQADACCRFGMRQVAVVATRINPRRRSAR